MIAAKKLMMVGGGPLFQVVGYISAPAPANQMNGIAFDGANLISNSYDSRQAFVHQGLSSTVSRQFTLPASSIQGMTVFNGNLISCGDGSNDGVFIHQGITATVQRRLAISPSPYGVAVDSDGNLIVSDRVGNVKIMQGLSETVVRTFFAPQRDMRGILLIGPNLITAGVNPGKIYKHAGVNAAISREIDLGSTVTGLAFTGQNLLSADPANRRVRIHRGR